MNRFLDFLHNLRNVSGSFKPADKVHVVLGNQSCDLDSTVCPLALAYFLKADESSTDTAVIPVLNIPEEEFPVRTENVYLLKKIGADCSTLIYRDTINLQDLQEKADLRVTLVDHHVLTRETEFLAKSVTEVFDHRPLDIKANWGVNVKVDIRTVGSCSTLITQEIYNKNAAAMTESLATLLYNTIIFDTIALSPEAGKVKELDIEMCQKIEAQFNIAPNHRVLFDELWTAHNDVSHLTLRQLLCKDLKVMEKVLIPGLPMLVSDFLKKTNVIDSLREFCQERGASVVVLMGLEARNNTVQRDMGLFALDEGEKLKCSIMSQLKNYRELEMEEFIDLAEVKYATHNCKLSRKQVLPKIQEAIEQFKNNVKI